MSIRNILLSALLLATLSLRADDVKPSVVVVGVDGKEKVVPIENVVRIDVYKDNITVSYTDGTHYTPYAEVDRILIGELRTASVDDIVVESVSSIGPTLTNGIVNISGVAEGTIVQAYNVAGVCVASATADSDGHAAVNLQENAPGTYVIRFGNCSAKVVRN